MSKLWGDHPYPHSPGYQDRATSMAAAVSINPRVKSLRDQVLDIMRASERGLTADEVATRLHRSILSIRPRVCELANLGYLIESGDLRPNVSGRPAIVWRIKVGL